MKKLLACLLVATMSGCPDVSVDPDETQQGPTVEFDPARSQATGARFIPFPNDLARDPMTGKVSLGDQACETPASKATRQNILNALDGFGTFETAMQVSFTAPVDPASLDGNIVMYQLTDQGMPLMPAEAMPIPVKVVRVGTTPRFASGDCNAPEMANAISFVPLVPLEQKSTYFVALKKGIRSTDGKDFGASYTWTLVSSTESPVTLDADGNIVSDRTPLDPADPGQRAQLQALAQMWKLHAPGLAFVAGTANPISRTDILVGFQFTTQTVTDPLDPAVEGSPASKLASVGLLQPQSVTGRFGPRGAEVCAEVGQTDPTKCFLRLALGGCSPLTTGCEAANYMAGDLACGLYSCDAIADVIGAGVATTNYQQQVPNPLAGAGAIQGAWSDPNHPEQQGALVLETIVVVPTGNAPPTGWPTIVFSHGLGSSKESVFAIAGRLAALKYATVAIDTSAHGSRAARISKDINLGCIGRCFDTDGNPTATECDTIAQCGTDQKCGKAGVLQGFVPPSPTTAPQCYAPFLSPDLAATRDGIRQTVLDHLRVIKAIKACGESGCGALSFNPNKIYWVSHSLGSVLGGISAAVAPDIKTAVLNTGGVGWADFLENTETLAVRCSLVNGLIDAGILTGEKWNGGTTGLCTTDEWKAQPGYATFSAIGRWVLDPADPANFASRLATKRVLIQEVTDDTVMPNLVTKTQAALLGLAGTPLMNDPWNFQPSAAITTSPTTNKYVRYTNDATSVFAHPSLLRPATAPNGAGNNGTLRLQFDAAEYLKANE